MSPLDDDLERITRRMRVDKTALELHKIALKLACDRIDELERMRYQPVVIGVVGPASWKAYFLGKVGERMCEQAGAKVEEA